MPFCSLDWKLLKYVSYSWCFLGTKTVCKTVSGLKPNEVCIFPFGDDNVTYNRCTRIKNELHNLKAWCSVKVDHSGKHIQHEWGYCEPACQPDSCFTDNQKCIGSREKNYGKIEHYNNKTHDLKFDARTETHCKFPFKYKDDDVLH